MSYVCGSSSDHLDALCEVTRPTCTYRTVVVVALLSCSSGILRVVRHYYYLVIVVPIVPTT